VEKQANSIPRARAHRFGRKSTSCAGQTKQTKLKHTKQARKTACLSFKQTKTEYFFALVFTYASKNKQWQWNCSKWIRGQN